MLAGSAEISSRTRWREAETILGSDPRFAALADVREREDLFTEFVTELGKKEKEDRRGKEKQRMDGFRALLEEAKGVTAKSKWGEVSDLLEGDPRNDDLDQRERATGFQAFIKELQVKEEQERKQEREAKRKVDRAARDAFRDFLKAKIADNSITARTKWKEAVRDLEEQDEFKAMAGQSGAKQEDIFDDLMDDLKEEYRKHRKLLKELVRKSSFVFTAETTFEAFCEGIKAADDSATEDSDQEEKKKDRKSKSESSSRSRSPPKKRSLCLAVILEKHAQSAKTAFSEFMEDAAQARKDAERKLKKLRENYVDLLQDYYYRSDHVGVVWDEAKGQLSKHSAFSKLPEGDRQPKFEEYMADLRAKSEKNPKRRKVETGESNDGDGEAEQKEGADLDTAEDAAAKTAADLSGIVADKPVEEHSGEKKSDKRDKKKKKGKDKKEKGDKKSSSKKKSRRRSSSSSSSDDEDDRRDRDRRSSRKRSKRSYSSSEDDSDSSSEDDSRSRRSRRH